MAFDGRELVATAVVVIVRMNPCVVREVIFASFAVLAGSRLACGNIGRLCVKNSNCSFLHKSFLLLLP